MLIIFSWKNRSQSHGALPAIRDHAMSPATRDTGERAPLWPDRPVIHLRKDELILVLIIYFIGLFWTQKSPKRI